MFLAVQKMWSSELATPLTVAPMTLAVDISFVHLSWFQQILSVQLATSAHITPMMLVGNYCQKGLSHLSSLELQNLLLMKLK